MEQCPGRLVDGTLASRKEAGALLTDPDDAGKPCTWRETAA